MFFSYWNLIFSNYVDKTFTILASNMWKLGKYLQLRTVKLENLFNFTCPRTKLHANSYRTAHSQCYILTVTLIKTPKRRINVISVKCSQTCNLIRHRQSVDSFCHQECTSEPFPSLFTKHGPQFLLLVCVLAGVTVHKVS